LTFGNEITQTEYDYNPQGRLLNSLETSPDGEKLTDFYYDNNGSQISKMVSTIADPTGTAEYTLSLPGTGTGDEVTYQLDGYDTFRRLTSVHNDNYTAEYAYNADGLRISKNVMKAGVATSSRFLYEGGYVTLELDGTGNETAHNVYGGDSIISRRTSQGTVYYLYNG